MAPHRAPAGCGFGAQPAVRLLPGLVEEEQKSLPRMSANRQSIYQIIIAPQGAKSNGIGAFVIES